MASNDKKKSKTNTTKQKRSQHRGKLVIVESPAKAKTVGRILGRGYKVKASVGHVRDLLKSRLSVDVENNFEPTYRVLNDKREVVKELAEEAAKAKEIYLATDLDREGEAIAWHLIHAAKIDPDRVRRVVFHEITDEAIKEAFAHPRSVNMDLVDAQQTRRILDRLVGYQITPILWDRVRSRLSAGRVQSVAVRLIVEREREIETFEPEEYWTIDAELCGDSDNGCEPKPFVARLVKINDEKAEFKREAEVKPHLDILERADYVVSEVKRGTRRRKPAAPFTTSTLQQDAARQLGFTTRKTMSLAQKLYEGIDIGEGVVGLITYMRTDSTHVAETAQNEALAFIEREYGPEYRPEPPNIYKTRSKGAQEAHEAIRPTGVKRTPQAIKKALSRDEYRLYNLIWQRFIASQMTDAVYDTLRLEVEAGRPGEPRPYLFRVSGSILKFKGFLAVYEEARDEDAALDEDEGRDLPNLTEGELMRLLRLLPQQHWTQPPPRFTEASLVKTLEDYSIGRPSTYAPIISTVQQRGYVTRDENKRLVPTETGELVNDLLVEYFPDVIDVTFTAQMEEELDEIAQGEKQWVPVIREFYGPFKERLKHARQHMPEVRTEEEIGRVCPKCGSPLIVRWGRYGKFIGCSNYPECRHTEPWLEKIGVVCPQCGTGEVVRRRTKRGRVFYGCSNYPECEFTSWKRPLSQPCPECGGLLVEERRDHAQCTTCESRFVIDQLAAQTEAA
ncbi:MAG: type I DNA topoisomerase [Anaerolineae bacterium]|nr:type I DNA topoisomerase [Anaerolineae bacterium]